MAVGIIGTGNMGSILTEALIAGGGVEPSEEELFNGVESPQVAIGGTSNDNGNGKININTASEKELEEIPGIGPSKAAAIIEYRKKNGPFKKTQDLDKVSGIGEKSIDRMKDQITVQ